MTKFTTLPLAHSLAPRLGLLLIAGLFFGASSGCDGLGGASVLVERLPDIEPNLPAVPKIPPPEFPAVYEDGTYSVYGARQRAREANGEEIEVTARIVRIYHPPSCERGETCPRPLAPHLFIRDKLDAEERDLMMVVGYAANQAEIDDAIRQGARGAERVRAQGMVPVPRDFRPGNLIRLKGELNLQSSSGFSSSNGLIEYTDHVTLERAQ